jgi:site-specific DNA-methyltransferase (adenine-specific)
MTVCESTLPINRIVCGDNVATMATFPDASIDLVVTSPPYDNLRTYGGHSWDFEGVANQLWRVIKPGGVVVWVVADATVNGSETGTSFRQALRFMEIGFRLHDTMIWDKENSTMPDAVRYFQSWEYCFVFSKGSPRVFNAIKDRKNTKSGQAFVGTIRQKDGTTKQGPSGIVADFGSRFNLWRVSPEKSRHDRSHPAVFPEPLARDHILSWSNEGDIVLDPFSGSGTTAKMAKHNGRRFIGIDINPEYCEIAEKRLLQSVLF